MAKTQLGFLLITFPQFLEKRSRVGTNTTEQIGDRFGRVGGLGLNAGECRLDITGKSSIGDTEHDLGLLGRRDVEGDGGLEVIGHQPLADGMDVLEGLGGRSPNGVRSQINHLAELGEVLGGLLDLVELQADIIALVDDLEESVACRRLIQKKQGLAKFRDRRFPILLTSCKT